MLRYVSGTNNWSWQVCWNSQAVVREPAASQGRDRRHHGPLALLCGPAVQGSQVRVLFPENITRHAPNFSGHSHSMGRARIPPPRSLSTGCIGSGPKCFTSTVGSILQVSLSPGYGHGRWLCLMTLDLMTLELIGRSVTEKNRPGRTSALPLRDTIQMPQSLHASCARPSSAALDSHRDMPQAVIR